MQLTQQHLREGGGSIVAAAIRHVGRRVKRLPRSLIPGCETASRIAQPEQQNNK